MDATMSPASVAAAWNPSPVVENFCARSRSSWISFVSWAGKGTETASSKAFWNSTAVPPVAPCAPVCARAWR
jgi:hypothetical protein